jgi:putative acetyltransferase
MIEIRPIKKHEIAEAKRLIFTVAYDIFKEAGTLDESIAKYSAEGKLHDLNDVQRNYFENRGTFLVAAERDQIIGTGAIKFLEEEVCGLKRLWVVEEYHGQRVGYRIMQKLLMIAREKKYKLMRLETDRIFQTRAVEFYKRLGFYEIPHYGDDPDDMAMELEL